MKEYHYKTQGTCSSDIYFKIDEENIIRDVKFERGCSGNLKGIAALCLGLDAKDAASKLEGITCGSKNTSCPDQFAKALKSI